VAAVALRVDHEAREARLSVHDFIALLPRRGHYQRGSGLVTNAQLGSLVHQMIAGERRRSHGAAYRAEVPLSLQAELGGYRIHLRGRADGVLRRTGGLWLEEVKSSRRPMAALMATRAEDLPLYCDQLRAYLYMLGREEPVRGGSLCLYSLPDRREHRIDLPYDRAVLDEWFEKRLEGLVDSLDAHRRRCEERATAADLRPFPFPSWRGEQRAMADAVRGSLDAGRPLLLEAPTGAGKTMAALWAALRHADAHGRTVLWATTRGPHQEAVLAATTKLNAGPHPVRAVQLGARERLCFLDRPRCNPQDCSFAHEHYDRLDAYQPGPSLHPESPVARARILHVAEVEHLCPYDLALSLGDDADLVICDVAQVFDPLSRLRRYLAEGEEAHHLVVVDEAHELPARARDWLSSSLHAEQVEIDLKADGVWPRLAPLRRICNGPAESLDPSDPAWMEVLDSAAQALLEELVQREAGDEDEVLNLLRRIGRVRLGLQHAAEAKEEQRFRFERDGQGRIDLRCQDPSSLLAEVCGRLSGAVFLSATLSPMDHHAHLFGLPEAQLHDAPDPFDPAQRLVLLATGPSTRFRHRNASSDEVAALLDSCLDHGDGHWLVYFPSFAYRDLCIPLLGTQRELLLQPRHADDDERTAMLRRLSSPGQDRGLAFCGVLGGIFGAGIDPAPGTCSGVAVVGPALPQIGPDRDGIAEHFQQRFGRGFYFAYQVPGMRRVVQAAGRALRAQEDRVAIVLIGQRFAQRATQALLPGSWTPRRVRNAEQLRLQLDGFFGPGAE
jgi:DNA excision repair protein ERCC-2